MINFDRITLLLLAQQGDAAPPAGSAPGWESLIGSPLLMIVPIAILFYFMMYLPEKKKRQQAQQMLSQLKKNDRVVTIGGILGTVVNVPKDAEDITIRVDEKSNTRMRVLRSAISRVISEKDKDSSDTGETLETKS